MAAIAMRRSDFKLAADPNVIPFIDVLLVLLIIFMVTAPKPTTDLRVDLPRPGPHIAAAIPPTIVNVRAAPAGFAVFIGSEETNLQSLGADALTYMMAFEPALEPEDAFADGRIYVRADLDVAYQHVITVIEALQDARFRKVAIYAQNTDE
jgi:biopolymer transport protein ExbD